MKREKNIYVLSKKIILMIFVGFIININSINKAYAGSDSAPLPERVGLHNGYFNKLENFLEQYLQLGAAFVLAASMVSFVLNIIALGGAGTNAQAREKAIRGIYLSGIAGALVGVSGVIHSLVMIAIGK